MSLRTLKQASLYHKRVLLRVDCNVPMKNGKVTDDTRIRAALPTIEYILESGASLILMSHLGRPKGEKNPALSLAPVVQVLSMLLQKPVVLAEDTIGDTVKQQASLLKPGEMMFLENLRFYTGETKNDVAFVQALASLANIYVNDAFATSHRAHASTAGIASVLPSYAGFLIEREISAMQPVLQNPKQPMLLIVGGAKVSTKIAVLSNFLPHCSSIIIGGGMAYTFLKVQGYEVGKSLVEDDFLKTASDFLRQAEEQKVNIVLPVDHQVTQEYTENAHGRAVESIPIDWMALDIGEKTVEICKNVIAAAKTIVWNGPMGVFEFPNFIQGTKAVAQAVADSSAVSIVGGGDSIAALKMLHLTDRVTHASTGGGASLEFLEGKVLPGIAALEG